jgi:hypothetical protein
MPISYHVLRRFGILQAERVVLPPERGRRQVFL